MVKYDKEKIQGILKKIETDIKNIESRWKMLQETEEVFVIENASDEDLKKCRYLNSQKRLYNLELAVADLQEKNEKLQLVVADLKKKIKQ